MGRPVADNPLSITVAARLTAEEALALREAAAKAGLSPAAYIREQLTTAKKGGRRRKAKPGPLADAQDFHIVRTLGVELVRQGRNLNQIQHRLNQQYNYDPDRITTPPELKGVLADIHALLAKVRPALAAALGETP